MPKRKYTTKRFPRENLLHKPFNRLTAIGLAGRNEFHRNEWQWLWHCTCGGLLIAPAYRVKSGATKSCGCLPNENRYKHGMSKRASASYVPEYGVWLDMRGRCFDSNGRHFHHYGGRGILPCAGFGDFNYFFAVVGSRPSSKHSLDHKDNDGGYWCGRCAECTANHRLLNVRWATQFQQMQNMSRNRNYTYKDETLCVSEWARRTGIGGHAMQARIDKWGIERALTTPKFSHAEIVRLGVEARQAKEGVK